MLFRLASLWAFSFIHLVLVTFLKLFNLILAFFVLNDLVLAFFHDFLNLVFFLLALLLLVVP